jgi:hypothetical protein
LRRLTSFATVGRRAGLSRKSCGQNDLTQQIITVKQFNFGVEIFLANLVTAELSGLIGRWGYHRVRALSQSQDLHLGFIFWNPHARYGDRDHYKGKGDQHGPALAKQHSDEIAQVSAAVADRTVRIASSSVLMIASSSFLISRLTS